MNYFLTSANFTLQQRLGSLRNWLVLLLLPLLALMASVMLPDWQAESPVSVGVVLPESGSKEMWQLLQARNDGVISFILTDEDTLDRNIAAGRWDCGIILSKNFDQMVQELDTDRIFTLRIGPGSTVYPLVKETISACMAQLIAPDIAMDYLWDSGIIDEDIFLQLEEPDRVLVSMSTLDNKPLRVPELTTRSTQNLLRWLICITILVRMLFGTADLAKWIHSPGMKRTEPLRSPLCSMAARGGADALLLFLSALSAMLLLGDGFRGCIAVLGYVVFWLMVSLLLAQFPAVTMALHVFIPFAVVISFLLSSVLMDISLIFPQLSGISRWLPASMFLGVCNGNWKDFLLLMDGGFLWLIAAWVISVIKKKT